MATKQSAAEITFNVITGILLWLVVCFPIIILTTVPLTIVRLLHHILAHIFRPDLIPITNAIDNIIILKPSSEMSMMNAAQVWRIRGKLDIHKFRENFEEIFLSTPELRLKYRNLYCYFVKWGLYCFKKTVDSIDLNDRIREYTGKPLESGPDLDSFIGKWMSTTDYGHRPNWEILIVHLKTDESAFLFKCDHGLIDGYTFVHLIEKLSGTKAPYIVQENTIDWFTRMKYITTFPKVLLGYSTSFLFQPQIPLPDYTPSTPLSADGQEWMVSFTTLDLNSVKKVRQMTKAHFNTVLATIEAGALRRYSLETSGEEVSQLPEFCCLPSPTGWPKHPAMMHGGMCNHLTVTATMLPFREANCLKRLLEAEKDVLKTLDVGLEVGARWVVTRLLWPVPPSMIVHFMLICFKIGVYKQQAVFSPLMCSSQKHQLIGHSVDHIYLPVHVPMFLRPAHLYMVPVSNSGQLDLSINSTKKIFKSQAELDRFTKVYLKEELENLVSAVSAQN